MTLMSGESLVNDATALTVFKVAIAAAIGTATSWGAGLRTFFVASVGGVLIGFVARLHRARRSGCGWPTTWWRAHWASSCRSRATCWPKPCTGSGVLAVVTAGLYLGHFAPYAGFATRLQETVVWRSFDVLLESLVFALIGLNFRFVLRQAAAGGHPAASLVRPIVAVLLATMLVRLVWVFPTTNLPRWLRGRAHRRGETLVGGASP